jgi:hypothetical protein
VKTIFDREIEESKLNSLNDLRSNKFWKSNFRSKSIVFLYRIFLV